MKFVKLSQPTTVDGVLRNPIEGEIPTSDTEAKRLKDNNLLDGEPTDFPDIDEGDGDDDSAADLKKLSLPDLHILVTKEGVPLHGVTKKDEVIAAITKYRADKAQA
ncbi:hypothetical protein [Sphingobium sp. Z007]|uniref:hypothetical protein n=1 Tax=Sphingobium sp. Z007 TaxID=627495 RepID=UPI000B4A233D|nr:hypothetical protein [Sphingobium sp. Z007]